MNLMWCFANRIPLNIHVCSHQAQPCLNAIGRINFLRENSSSNLYRKVESTRNNLQILFVSNCSVCVFLLKWIGVDSCKFPGDSRSTDQVLAFYPLHPMLSFSLFLTPVAGSIFRPLSLTQKSGSEFSDEILRSALLDIQPTFKCPVEWIHVIPPPRLDWMKMD